MSPSPTSSLEKSSYFEKDAAVRTPPMRDSFDANVSPEPLSTGCKTRGSTMSDFSEELHHNHDSPQQPFLAYGRRRRTFSSPFQLNKARYLLSFADEDTAQQWWQLIQSEYPSSVRDSSQLFSFKDDSVPDKAQQSPKFEHLKGKWSYRLVDGTTDHKQFEDNTTSSDRRTSFARTPSMPTLREDSVISGIGKLEDPFTPNDSGSKPLLDKVDFAQLSITSDRIHRSVSQSNLQLDVLLEGQQASAKGMQKLQAAVDRLTTQMEIMSRRHLENENALQEFRTASIRDAFGEEPQEDDEAVTLLSIQSSLAETSARIKDMHERRPPTPVSPNPSNEIIQRLQKEVSQNTTALQSLTAHQTATKKTLQKINSLLDLTCAEQKLLSAQIRQAQIQSENNHALTLRFAENQNARFDKLEAAMAKQAAQSRKQMTAQQDELRTSMNEVLMAVKKSQQPQIVKVNCGHEVFAPPRKLDRKLVGYVYEHE